MNEIHSLVYYNGSKNIGVDGLSFEGERRGMIIIRGTTAEDLYEKIRRKFCVKWANQPVP